MLKSQLTYRDVTFCQSLVGWVTLILSFAMDNNPHIYCRTWLIPGEGEYNCNVPYKDKYNVQLYNNVNNAHLYCNTRPGAIEIQQWENARPMRKLAPSSSTPHLASWSRRPEYKYKRQIQKTNAKCKILLNRLLLTPMSTRLLSVCIVFVCANICFGLGRLPSYMFGAALDG